MLQSTATNLREKQAVRVDAMGRIAGLTDKVFIGLGALVGLLLTAVVGKLALGASRELPLLIAPLGASAVLLFAAPESPLARPWNMIGGNILSAFIGVASGLLIADPVFAAPIACGTAITLMMIAGCLHPPGGAVALTAVIGGPSIQAAGFGFALWPVGISTLLLLATALVFNHAKARIGRAVPA